jgi:hypothetical protein
MAEMNLLPEFHGLFQRVFGCDFVTVFAVDLCQAFQIPCYRSRGVRTEFHQEPSDFPPLLDCLLQHGNSLGKISLSRVKFGLQLVAPRKCHHRAGADLGLYL